MRSRKHNRHKTPRKEGLATLLAMLFAYQRRLGWQKRLIMRESEKRENRRAAGKYNMTLA